MPWPICAWAASKSIPTARPKALPNASGRWHWIEIWPLLTQLSVSPRFLSVAARKPRLTSTRRSASVLAIRTPICGWRSRASPSCYLGSDEEAVALLRRAIETNRNYPLAHFCLAAALAHLGRLNEARAAVQAGLALDPTFTISRHSCQRAERQSDLFGSARAHL